MNEIDEELRFHLEELVRRGIVEGLDPEEARRRAIARFGSVDELRGRCEGIAKGGVMSPNSLRESPPERSVRTAIVTIGVLVATTYAQKILGTFAFYRGLYRVFPFFVPETLKNLLEIGLCLAALRWLRGARGSDAERELGLRAPILPALGLAIAATSPMLVGFALTRASSGLSVPAIVYLTLFAPFTEELVSRGFGFGLLYRRAGWPFWAAVLLVAVLTGLAHVEKGQSTREIASLFFLTGAGAVSFSWLYRRWGNLWVPFALHFAMNLWWEVFDVSKTVLGGWFPLLLQTVSIAIAIAITGIATRRRPATPDASERVERRRDGGDSSLLRRAAVAGIG